MNEGTSPEMEAYFQSIEKKVDEGYAVAKAARKKGFDPEEKVDSPLARNMVERVEGLISAVAPQLIGSGVTERMFALEKEFGVLDWRVALVIAEEVSKEKFCKFKDKREAMEVGIRTGFAYHTLGIVAAPLEGFVNLEIKKTKKGEEYFALRFAGPIRGAGGTGASVCVLIGDYVRKKMGYAPYDPDENEVKRFAMELNDYHDRVTNLQYHPSDEESEFLAKNIPVEITGDPTEKIEVSNYKDLPRVDTNKIRGGLCLVLSMVALKAPKLWKRLEKWGDDLDLDWGFMKDFIILQKKKKSEGAKPVSGEKPKISPNKTFIVDLVAGRPVLTHPMAYGGFRLRYGRARTTGYSAMAIHPATMVMLNDFIAIGTQLKVERPGKAASMTSCDSIEGPIVRLLDGSVVAVKTYEQAKKLFSEVESILFLGDILINYGDFSENGHTLVPGGYCPEWWALEVKDHEEMREYIENPLTKVPSICEAVEFAMKTKTPLHPEYTYYWVGLGKNELITLVKALDKATIECEEYPTKIVMEHTKEIKKILERIGMPHLFVNKSYLVIEEGAYALLATLGLQKNSCEEVLAKITHDLTLENLKEIAPFIVRDKAGTFIGARMGRPEKAKMRKLIGNPHSLFPVGEEGGRMRSFQASLEKGKVTSSFAIYKYANGEESVFSADLETGEKGVPVEFEFKGEKQRYQRRSIDIHKYFDLCLKKMKTQVYPDLIKGVRGTSNKDHIPEHLMKGILRAKHNVFVNKDGTVRYDMTELPITHFKPKEIGTSIEKLKGLGYVKDIKGEELTHDDQVLELRAQDVILPANTAGADEPADEVLFRVGNFVDDLLVSLYNEKPYFNFTTKSDVVGELVIGLAPHISAGMIGRIIGFSNTSGCFAHPLWHAALRRDCDGDEASVSLLLDSLLNFSRQYLPDRIGSRTMDAPLVLTARLVPSEVDDMVHGLDVVYNYPLEFYEAALAFKAPWDVGLEQLGKRLGKPSQYEGIGFTHSASDINKGVSCSAYKLLPSMREKLDGQMNIAEKVAAVDTSDVARLVIEKHFIKDIKGNLRKFSMQQFRCVDCNEKFRRPPLKGVCNKCAGKILFTISEGSVIKYMEPALSLARKYHLSPYLQQTLELTKTRIDEVFGRERERQEGLGKWFG